MDEQVEEIQAVAVLPDPAPDFPDKLQEEPERDDLAVKWRARLQAAERKWGKFFKRCAHNRQVVAGFDWGKDPAEPGFIRLRANLIQGTITTLMPTIYARNPEIEVRPMREGAAGDLFAKTLEACTNRELGDGGLKTAAKAAVRGALTTSIGAVKITWQEDRRSDPVILHKLEDQQDNLDHVRALILQLDDPGRIEEQRRIEQELEQTMAALREKAEVVVSSGLVVDRVLIDNLLLDPTIQSFEDYPAAGWIAQMIPMKRSDAEGMYGLKLSKATRYKAEGSAAEMSAGANSRPVVDVAGAGRNSGGAAEDDQVLVYEIWDKATERVYTLAQGCDFWLRPPYSPEGVGHRWYPFFLLPFQVVDGNVVGPSLVDLVEQLQVEHNKARDAFNRYRELAKPGWLASSEVKPEVGKPFVNSEFGDVTFLNIESDVMRNAIVPKTYPQLSPEVYDTSALRQDWEMVSGLQDAARTSVVKAKTATEAQIMQNSQAGRVAEFQDQLEDWLSEIANYAAEILLFRMPEADVQRIMGGAQGEGYDWPQLNKEEIFSNFRVAIRAGSSGKPNKLEEQETWGKLLPTILQIIQAIVQYGMQGVDVEPLKYLLKQTVSRFDDSIDVNSLIPDLEAMKQQQQQQQLMQQLAAQQQAGASVAQQQ